MEIDVIVALTWLIVSTLVKIILILIWRRLKENRQPRLNPKPTTPIANAQEDANEHMDLQSIKTVSSKHSDVIITEFDDVTNPTCNLPNFNRSLTTIQELSSIQDQNQEYREIDEVKQKGDEKFENCKKNLKLAINSGTIDELHTAIEWSIFNGYQSKLRDEIFKARETLRQKQNLQRMRESLIDVKQSVISELRSYNNPPKAVHDVMMCVYMLLKVKREDELQAWSSVQALMSQTGRYNLKRLIERHNRDDLTESELLRIKRLLVNYDFQFIHDVSKGAAVFYVWLMDLIEDHQLCESSL